MNIKKIARCHVRMDSRWVSLSAALMGLSVFLRTVYYFGVVNLRDLDHFRLAMEVIVPLVLAGGYLIVVKGFQFNSPVLVGCFMGLYGVNYLLIHSDGGAGIACGVILMILAVGMIVTGLGFLPNSIPVIGTALVLALVRLIAVDFNGYFQSMDASGVMDYLPVGANLLIFLSLSLMAPPLNVTLRGNSSAAAPRASVEEPENVGEDIPLPELEDILTEEPAPAVAEEPAVAPAQEPEFVVPDAAPPEESNV